MSITVMDGPFGTVPGNPYGTDGYGGANQNPQEGPSFFHRGWGLLDPRRQMTYVNGQSVSRQSYMYLGNEVIVIDAVPSALAANNIATSGSTNPITLVSSSGAGITVGASVVNAITQTLVTGLLAIDSAMAPFAFGQDGTMNLWDPSKAIARTLRFVSGGNDSGITFTVTGFDIYGFPMSETITGANAGTATGLKAWKYIQQITRSGAVASTLTIGTTDVFGFGLRSDIWGDQAIVWNNNWVTANTGYLAAVTTNPATATTGDVRGTYAVQGAASDGTRRLVVYQASRYVNSQSITGVFGVAQNLSANNG